MNNRVDVTKSFLPPIEEYIAYLKAIWENGTLTNEGPLLQQFEKELSKYVDNEKPVIVTNGTLALQLALKAVTKSGDEIITTPFSYVATTSAILWEGLRPVYVDVDRDTFNIDINKIEKAISPRTSAILAVHVFGNPCEIESLEAIAKKHNIKVVYDAAHAFGVMYKGKSLLSYGDISTCSFHATKIFHTIEGGCVVSRDSDLTNKIELSKRFGHTGDSHYQLGINAKASEFQAAMGLCNLNYIKDIISKRKRIYSIYKDKLSGKYNTQQINSNTEYNYSYFPLVFPDADAREAATSRLNQMNIFPRRYFNPSLNNLPYLPNTNKCPISERIASTILCLPMSFDIEDTTVDEICKILMDV